MKLVRALSFAVALILAPLSAWAQQYPTVPGGTVIGRTQFSAGPAQAIPFDELLTLLLSGTVTFNSLVATTATITTLNATTLTANTANVNSVVYKGSSSGQVTVQAQAAAGTPTVKWPTSSGTVADTATSPIVLDPVTGNISCPTCATGTSSAILYATTRAAAQAQNLSAYSVVITAGYAAAGDGGGATYFNNGSTVPFDSFWGTGSIGGAGSGYVNGTYFVQFSGVTRMFGQVVVSGGAVTSVTVTQPGYSVPIGAVATVTNSQLGGSGSGFSYIPLSFTMTGSFADAGGTYWQIKPTPTFNIRQFGAKQNWAGVDASAADDTVSIQNALWAASYPTCSLIAETSGGCPGQRLYVPQGTSKLCTNTIHVPDQVILTGVGRNSSQFMVCAGSTFPVANTIFILGTNLSHAACFGAGIQDLGINASAASVSGTAALVYSNNCQDGVLAKNIYLNVGGRAGLWFETGYGGASYISIEQIEIDASGGANDLIHINYGTTFVHLRDIVEAGGAAIGTNILGGIVDIDGLHCESLISGVQVTSAGTLRFHNGTGGPGCTNLLTLALTNTYGNTVVGALEPNGSQTVNNGQTGGASVSTRIVADQVFNP